MPLSGSSWPLRPQQNIVIQSTRCDGSSIIIDGAHLGDLVNHELIGKSMSGSPSFAHAVRALKLCLHCFSRFTTFRGKRHSPRTVLQESGEALNFDTSPSFFTQIGHFSCFVV